MRYVYEFEVVTENSHGLRGLTQAVTQALIDADLLHDGDTVACKNSWREDGTPLTYRVDEEHASAVDPRTWHD